jgi:hypothetical protein
MVDSADAIEGGRGEAQIGDPFPTLKSLKPQLRMKILFVKAGYAKAGSGSGRDSQTAQAAIAELNKLELVSKYVPEDMGGVLRFSNNKEDTEAVTALGGGKDYKTAGALYGIP